MLKNNHAYSQKIHSSTKSNSEEWIAEWKAFQSRQGKNTEQIKEYHRKLNSKSGLVSQTQANYNNETNKFILYTIFNVIFGAGAVYVSMNLIRAN